MADTKLSALTELAATPADTDEVYIRDVSEAASAESKRITIANLLAGAGGATLVLKTADEVVTNNTTPQNDDHLLFAVGANEVWAFYMLLRYKEDASIGLKAQFTVPTGGAIEIITHNIVGPASGTADLNPIAAATTWNYGAQTTTRLGLHWCVYIGGGNAGNVQFQWAQLNTSGSALTVEENSFIIAHKLA